MDTNIKHKYPVLEAPYGEELKLWNALFRALQHKQNHSIVDASSNDATNDGEEVFILRRSPEFYK